MRTATALARQQRARTGFNTGMAAKQRENQARMTHPAARQE